MGSWFHQRPIAVPRSKGFWSGGSNLLDRNRQQSMMFGRTRVLLVWGQPEPFNAPCLTQILQHPEVFAETLDPDVVYPVACIPMEGPLVDQLHQLVVGQVQVAPDAWFVQLEV